VTRVAGLLDGTLYTADGSTIRAYDVGADGDEERHQWSVDHPASGGGDPRRSYGLLPTPDGVFWATHGRLDAFGPDGGHQWGFTSPGSGAVFPAVAEGRLYVAVPGALLAASRPGVLADVLDQGPSTAWRSETHSRATWPVATDDRVIVGDRDFPNTPGSNSVQAIRPDGSREWGHDVQGATSHLVLSEATGRVVFVTVDEETGEGAVTALDVATGKPAWTRTDLELTGQVGAIALAGDTVLVTGFVRTAEKPVRALAIEDGETRWTRSVRGHPTAMAAAGGRVFVGTALGNVVAFE
jgi:outer membrane protein assembly factor BamB